MKIIALHPEMLAIEALALAHRIGGRIVWLSGHICIRTGATPCAH